MNGRDERTLDPLSRRVRSTPDRLALVDGGDGTTWRYDELDAAVAEVAKRLAGLDLEAGDRLGLLSGTSIEAVLAVHAAWRLGVTLVPLNVRLAEPELARRMSRCDLDALVCAPETEGLADVPADCPVAVLGSERDSGASGRLRPVGPEPWGADDTALVLFTSGTTGEPKGVRLTMGNLLASATASAFRLGVLPTDRWLLCLPVYHMGGLAPVLRSAHYGTGLVVQDGFEPDAVVRATHDYDVTGLSLVPTMLRRVLDERADLAGSVRTVLLGGAPAPEALIERCRQSEVPVHPTYGLTETASQVATATPAQAFEHDGTVGQSLLGTTVTVVDGDGDPLPAGETGELVVDGPTVTPGYLDDPTATAFDEHGLRTGDLGHVDGAGRLWVTGRVDDRIVTGGENVDPATVAAALREHADVEDAAVVGLTDPEWGERVAALVVPSSGDGPSLKALEAHCRERLAGFEVPRTVAFADELPRTASGTVDRAAAVERLRE